MRLQAATFQGEPVPGNVPANISVLCSAATSAATAGSDLLLFPELFLTGYNLPPTRLKSLAINQNGIEMKQIRDIAVKNCIAIAIGYAESVVEKGVASDSVSEGGEIVYNSCILIDSIGRTVVNYRKCHLWDPYFEHERLAFVPGNCLPTGDLKVHSSGEVIKIGILICFDCEFPEPARVLALQGAQVVLIPTALAEGPVADSTPTVTVPGRAAENNFFIVYSNLIGSSLVVGTDDHEGESDNSPPSLINKSNFCGQSGIFGPDGSDLARASKTATGIFSAVLDSSKYKAYIDRNNYLEERRPELYAIMSARKRDTSNVAPFIHLNAAGDSPMPSSVVVKIKNVLDTEHELGGYAAAEEVFAEEFESVYESVGELINCSPNNIALVDSATTAWVKAFYSISLHSGDIILTCAVEYASNYVAILQQAKRFNATVITIPSDADGTVSVSDLIDLLREYGDRVKVVSITWIPTNGGVINDAEAIGNAVATHSTSALYLLDACQAVGQVRVDVGRLQCHVLSATGRKYLRGPRGTGFLFVSDAGLQLLPEPATVDLLSAPWDGNLSTYAVVPHARRFEQWEKNVAGLLGLGESIQYLLKTIGQEASYDKIQSLAVMLRGKLSMINRVSLHDLGNPLQPRSRGGIVSFSISGLDADTIKQRLRAECIFVSVSGPTSTPMDATIRELPRLVRASVHYFNTPDEIEKFCEVIARLAT
jgi:selenocysteine lyase/cysteine desulfurase/predicted amidohydrolase